MFTLASEDCGVVFGTMFSSNVSRTPRRSTSVDRRRLSSSGTVTSPSTASLENRSSPINEEFFTAGSVPCRITAMTVVRESIHLDKVFCRSGTFVDSCSNCMITSPSTLSLENRSKPITKSVISAAARCPFQEPDVIEPSDSTNRSIVQRQAKLVLYLVLREPVEAEHGRMQPRPG